MTYIEYRAYNEVIRNDGFKEDCCGTRFVMKF